MTLGEFRQLQVVTVSLLRTTYGFRAGTLSLLVFAGACAQGSFSDTVDPLVTGGSGGDTATGGTDTSGTGGTDEVPMAGSTMGGGGMMTTAGTSPGGGDTGGTGDAGGMGGAGGTGGAGGAGGKAGAGGTGGAGGAASGHRYVKLVALTEQTGKVWSSIAELDLFTTGNAPIPKTTWSVSADSQELDDENVPAANAVDGNANTFWHTEWEPAPDDVNDAPLPHELIIDMGSARPVTGFTYLPRQDGPNGRIANWAFYVTNNMNNWGNPVKMGTFPAGTAAQTVSIP
jgi:hypothetical protein